MGDYDFGTPILGCFFCMLGIILMLVIALIWGWTPALWFAGSAVVVTIIRYAGRGVL